MNVIPRTKTNTKKNVPIGPTNGQLSGLFAFELPFLPMNRIYGASTRIWRMYLRHGLAAKVRRIESIFVFVSIMFILSLRSMTLSATIKYENEIFKNA